MSTPFKRLGLVLGLFCGLVLASPAQAAPRNLKKHALVKVAGSVVKVATAAPKATAVALKDTLGGVLFSVEAGVDVAHAATTALSAVASKELKHNPFEYVDEYVGKADSGLEKAYLFFFNASI